jgi:hypothetical protein
VVDLPADKCYILNIMNRPPPYFPQNQLSPPDPNRYKKFKILVAFGIVLLIAILGGIGFGIFYLIKWAIS